jgi:outer membrane protein assembly factor BamB
MRFVPHALAVVAVVLFAFLLWPRVDGRLQRRVPGTDQAPGEGAAAGGNPVLRGTLERGDGQPGRTEGTWPQFRGVNRDGTGKLTGKLARAWGPGQPRALWSVKLGEGYAGAVVGDGRLYLMDYDRERQRDTLRCLSTETGRDLWRFSYPVKVKRNHGMSRTVPAVSSNRVVAIGPKCHVLCVDAQTGELQWGLDLVRQFGATVPPWYTGQCPLIDGDRVPLAPGGPDALLVAVDLTRGEVAWKTPNPRGWRMTHASIMPGEFAGRRMYVYCASGGVVGVSAADGALLWETAEWKISIATVASPIFLDQGRIFLSGGYNAGSLMLQLEERDGKLVPKVLYRLKPEVFGATQHTPIHQGGYLYGVRPDGQFACLDLAGKTAWTSGPGQLFGLGPFLLADGLIFALNDSGQLSLISAKPTAFELLGQAKVLRGRESWGPLALVDGRLFARDLEEMVCLAVGE